MSTMAHALPSVAPTSAEVHSMACGASRPSLGEKESRYSAYTAAGSNWRPRWPCCRTPTRAMPATRCD